MLAKCANDEGTVEEYREKEKKLIRKKEGKNQGRKERSKIDEEITNKEWEDHFITQLEGKEIEEGSRKKEEK